MVTQRTGGTMSALNSDLTNPAPLLEALILTTPVSGPPSHAFRAELFVPRWSSSRGIVSGLRRIPGLPTGILVPQIV